MEIQSEDALVEVGEQLRTLGYEFTTITPETHRRVIARMPAAARTLRDVFGWSLPFDPALLPADLLAALRSAGAVTESARLLKSQVRFSTLAGSLYVHSAYPTTDERSVFFGPDTYRFCALLEREVATARRVVDVGCGSGVGALSLAARAARIVLTDINPQALACARVNARLGGIADRVEVVGGDLFAPVSGPVDLIIANPPYLVDPGQRVYRDGGGELGIGLGIRIVREGIARLDPGGRLILYTGAPVVNGEDLVRTALARIVDGTGAHWSYAEIDPDVFGEELDQPVYAAVDRIAAVAACITIP